MVFILVESELFGLLVSVGLEYGGETDVRR